MGNVATALYREARAYNSAMLEYFEGKKDKLAKLGVHAIEGLVKAGVALPEEVISLISPLKTTVNAMSALELPKKFRNLWGSVFNAGAAMIGVKPKATELPIVHGKWEVAQQQMVMETKQSRVVSLASVVYDASEVNEKVVKVLSFFKLVGEKAFQLNHVASQTISVASSWLLFGSSLTSIWKSHRVISRIEQLRAEALNLTTVNVTDKIKHIKNKTEKYGAFLKSLKTNGDSNRSEYVGFVITKASMKVQNLIRAKVEFDMKTTVKDLSPDDLKLVTHLIVAHKEKWERRFELLKDGGKLDVVRVDQLFGIAISTNLLALSLSSIGQYIAPLTARAVVLMTAPVMRAAAFMGIALPSMSAIATSAAALSGIPSMAALIALIPSMLVLGAILSVVITAVAAIRSYKAGSKAGIGAFMDVFAQKTRNLIWAYTIGNPLAFAALELAGYSVGWPLGVLLTVLIVAQGIHKKRNRANEGNLV